MIKKYRYIIFFLKSNDKKKRKKNVLSIKKNLINSFSFFQLSISLE